jgi:hypothetical protein
MELCEALSRIERIELEYREAMSRRESAENLAARFSPGSDVRERWTRSFAIRTEQVVKLRKELAQATLDAYGVGLDREGNIMWSEE